uniref:K Homology domain-containing protein n=1 Tax=Zooxanthella nutricula TaxID=1333877 RepID=A0A7S2ML10_9DINO
MTDEDGRRRGAPRSGGGGRGYAKAFKVLCPDPLIAAMIGTNGVNRKQIEEDNGVQLKFSNRDEFFPGTRCRVMVILANDMKAITAVLERAVQELIQVATREVGKGKGRDRDEGEMILGQEPGELVFRVGLPQVISGALIGHRGERITEIRNLSRAKLFVDNQTYESHQMLRVIGNPQSIDTALYQICQLAETELSEDDMRKWGAQVSFDPHAAPEKGSRKGSGKGKGKEDPHRGGPPGRRRSRSPPGGLRPAKAQRLAEEGEDGRPPVDDFPPDGPENPPEGHFPGPGYSSPLEAIDHVRQLADEFLQERLAVTHEVCCDLSTKRLDQMKADDFPKEVEQVTGCLVIFDEERGAESRTVRLNGPLVSVYAAHFMLMKRYHDDDFNEAEEERIRQEEEERERADGREDPGKIASLKEQLADLQRQLAEAHGGAVGDSRRKGGGKSKFQGKR